MRAHSPPCKGGEAAAPIRSREATKTPFSDDLRVQERWRRLDRDNMELTLTITDPKTFTKPWVNDTKRFRLQPKGSPNGELLEVIFTPMDEKDFNEKIRDLSNGVTKK